jgi:hypothetical protein
MYLCNMEVVMHWFSIGFALLVSAAIMAIGAMYILNPRGTAKSFGLPLPEAGENIAWWLRLKGVRDIVSGLVVLALLAWSGTRAVGVAMLLQSLIPLGDMSLILAARGSAKTAFGVHGVTAAVMVAAAIPLLIGRA